MKNRTPPKYLTPLEKSEWKEPSRRWKRVTATCHACGDPCEMKYPLLPLSDRDETWAQFVGSEYTVLYFCSEPHREDWWYDLYCK